MKKILLKWRIGSRRVMALLLAVLTAVSLAATMPEAQAATYKVTVSVPGKKGNNAPSTDNFVWDTDKLGFIDKYSWRSPVEDCMDSENGDTFSLSSGSSSVTLSMDNKKDGWETPCGMTPFTVTMEVPANTTYRVVYNMNLYTYIDTGEYSVGVLNGFCNKGLANTATQPSGDYIRKNKETKDTVKYLDTSANSDCIVGYDHDPYADYTAYTSDAAYADREKHTTDGTISFTFDNSQNSSAQTFTRGFVLYAYVGGDPTHLTNNQKNSFVYNFKATVTPSVESVVETTKGDDIAGQDSQCLVWTEETPSTIAETLKSSGSDESYASDTGWYRLLMQAQVSTENTISCYSGSTETSLSGTQTALTGQVSKSGFTSVQEYFTHPLGRYLKYAWLYNGETSMQGAQGYDYAVPQAVTKTRTQVSSTTESQTVVGNLTTGSTSSEDYDAWYVKYAGKDAAGADSYYLAMKGTDGKRYLLVNTFQIVEGNVETTQMFVTAEEYDAHPELYQTAYAWPTSQAAADNLTDASADTHSSHGSWQQSATAGGDNVICGDTLKDEAFRVSVSHNLQWEMFCDSSDTLYGFFNIPLAETDAGFEKSLQDDLSADDLFSGTLYRYYMTYKDSADKTQGDKVLLDAYADKIQACLDAYTKCTKSDDSNPAACHMCLTGTSTGKYHKETRTYTLGGRKYTRSIDVLDGYEVAGDSLLFHKTTKLQNNAIALTLQLGSPYTATREQGEIVVSEGETYTVTGTMKLAKTQEIVVEKGGTLEVKGTLVNNGVITCYGTTVIESGGCLRDDTATPIGQYNFVGGELIIAKNGIFSRGYAGSNLAFVGTDTKGRTEIENPLTGIVFNVKYTTATFSNGSTIKNDGLLLMAGAWWLKDHSTLDNGTNGVVTIGCTLKADLSTYGTTAIAKAFPRGMPTGEQLYNMVAGYDATAMRTYITDDTGDFSALRLNISDGSVIRNNGAIYDCGGIACTGSGCVLLGGNQLLHYSDMVKNDYKDASLSCLDFLSSDLSSKMGDVYNNSAQCDSIDSEVVVAFGTQSVQEALNSGTSMDYDTWVKTYNTFDSYVKPADDDDGC